MLENLSVEIIAIGNELLKGLSVNSNAAYIGRKLSKMGFSVARMTVLPDNAELLQEGLSEAMSCSRLVITTGGLGPTCDDISRAAAADLFHSPFHFDEKVAEDLKSRYGEAIKTLQDQATVPSKALVLQNPIGTAPGLIFHDGPRTLILLPGVPLEMKEIFDQQVMPFLEKHFQLKEKIYTEELHFANTYESEVDPILRELKGLEEDLDLGIYPSHGILTVLISSKEPLKLSFAANVLKKKFGERLFPSPNGKIEEAVHDLFMGKGITLSLAESCTGGFLASRLTSIPGASNYFLGSLVAYSNALKIKLLNVKEAAIQEKGAVSSEIAEAMAEGVMALTNSDYSLGITGIAGPAGGSADKPVGTVFYALKARGKTPVVKRLQAFGSRLAIIERSVNAALGDLYRLISTEQRKL